MVSRLAAKFGRGPAFDHGGGYVGDDRPKGIEQARPGHADSRRVNASRIAM